MGHAQPQVDFRHGRIFGERAGRAFKRNLKWSVLWQINAARPVRQQRPHARIVQVPTASATHFLVKLDLAAPTNFLSAAAVLQDAVASV